MIDRQTFPKLEITLDEINEVYYADTTYQSPMLSYASLIKGQKVIVSP
jgi:hypothetical protein